MFSTRQRVGSSSGSGRSALAAGHCADREWGFGDRLERSKGEIALFSGPPGSGKTMLARRIPTILPEMTRAEALETTKIYSALGLAHGLIDTWCGRGASRTRRRRPWRSAGSGTAGNDATGGELSPGVMLWSQAAREQADRREAKQEVGRLAVMRIQT